MENVTQTLSSGPGPSAAAYWTAKRISLALLTVTILGALARWLYTHTDDYRTVTEQMVWQCALVEDTKNARFPHVEGVKLWFVKNPHFEETASGPHLCAELKEAGQPYVTVTFEVWGNRFYGLHGYNETGMAVGSRQLVFYVYGAGLSSFHRDVEHPEDEKRMEYSDIRRFPLEVFK